MNSDSKEGLDLGMLQDVLGKEREAAEKDESNTLMKVATMFLDKDKDGSIVDDLIGMAGNFLKK